AAEHSQSVVTSRRTNSGASDKFPRTPFQKKLETLIDAKTHDDILQKSVECSMAGQRHDLRNITKITLADQDQPRIHGLSQTIAEIIDVDQRFRIKFHTLDRTQMLWRYARVGARPDAEPQRKRKNAPLTIDQRCIFAQQQKPGLPYELQRHCAFAAAGREK